MWMRLSELIVSSLKALGTQVLTAALVALLSSSRAFLLTGARELTRLMVEVLMRANSKMCRAWRSCPLCQLGDVGAYHGDRQNRKPRIVCLRGRDDMPIKKPEVSGAHPQSSVGARDGDEWVLYPNLLEFLTESKYEDGSARELATLLVFWQDGTWKGCLNDRDVNRNTFVSSGSIAGLLAVLEEKLSTSSVEWRSSGGKGRRK